eukprot:GILJ01007181.1.p1 GENE.GILJ01007181.1~~GILJ01007181.1.p1  ORF type:complete len:717 (-),score=38.76 GILJ01007181.1:183-2333(-)
MSTHFLAFEGDENQQGVGDVCLQNNITPVAVFLPARVSSRFRVGRRTLALNKLTGAIEEIGEGISSCACIAKYYEVPLDMSLVIPSRLIIFQVDVHGDEASAAFDSRNQHLRKQGAVKTTELVVRDETPSSQATIVKYAPLFSGPCEFNSCASTPLHDQLTKFSVENIKMQIVGGYLSIPDVVHMLEVCRQSYARVEDQGFWYSIAAAHRLFPSTNYIGCMGPVTDWRRYVKLKYLTHRPMKIARNNLAGTCTYTTAEALDPRSHRLAYCRSGPIHARDSYSNCSIPLDPNTIVYISMKGEVIAETLSAVADKRILWKTKISGACNHHHHATLTLLGGFIYIYNGGSSIYSLFASTGAVQWHLQLPGGGYLDPLPVRSRLLPIEDTLLFATARKLSVVSRDDGHVLFEILFPQDVTVHNEDSIDDGVVSLSLDAAMLTAFVRATGTVYVIDIDRRKVIRTHRLLEAEPFKLWPGFSMDATVVDGCLYGVASHTTRIPTLFFAIDLSIQGDSAWMWYQSNRELQQEKGRPFRPLLYGDNVICFGYDLIVGRDDVLEPLAEYSTISSYDRLTGTCQWTYKFYPGFCLDYQRYFPFCPIIVNGVFHVGLLNRHYAHVNYVSLDGKTGTLLRHLSVQGTERNNRPTHKCLNNHPLVVDGVCTDVQLHPGSHFLCGPYRATNIPETCSVLSVSPLQILVCFNEETATIGILQEHVQPTSQV